MIKNVLFDGKFIIWRLTVYEGYNLYVFNMYIVVKSWWGSTWRLMGNVSWPVYNIWRLRDYILTSMLCRIKLHTETTCLDLMMRTTMMLTWREWRLRARTDRVGTKTTTVTVQVSVGVHLKINTCIWDLTLIISFIINNYIYISTP